LQCDAKSKARDKVGAAWWWWKTARRSKYSSNNPGIRVEAQRIRCVTTDFVLKGVVRNKKNVAGMNISEGGDDRCNDNVEVGIKRETVRALGP